MIEVENKYRVSDPLQLITKLNNIFGSYNVPGSAFRDRSHVDNIFSAASVTNKSLARFRTYDSGEKELTLKGPAANYEVKSRTELNISDPYLNLVEVTRLLEGFGLSHDLTYRKTRLEFQLRRDCRDVNVAVDHLDGIGTFAEVEIICAEEGKVAAARTVVQAVAFDLDLTDEERLSYSQLIQRHRCG